MTYSIFARDGTTRIVLKRPSREAAEKKARELTDLGWFDVQIADGTQIEEAECFGKQLRVTSPRAAVATTFVVNRPNDGPPPAGKTRSA
jgi:hypothetical protein